MHATSPSPIHNAMKFQGMVGNAPVYALIDSDSTHTFINPTVLNTQLHNIVATNPMIVMVANGDRMVTDSKCESLQFSIQGQEFQHDLRVLPVKGYDVILGLDWLSKLGPMCIDWEKKWVQFEMKGKTVKLQVTDKVAQLNLCDSVELNGE
jgi:Retroviral aspartyl protease